MPQPASPLHELLVAKFEALLAECDLVADHAEYGQTLNDMDEFFLTQGRKLLQETFEAKLQERIERTEQHAEAQQCLHCKKKRVTTTKRRNA